MSDEFVHFQRVDPITKRTYAILEPDNLILGTRTKRGLDPEKILSASRIKVYFEGAAYWADVKETMPEGLLMASIINTAEEEDGIPNGYHFFAAFEHIAEISY